VEREWSGQSSVSQLNVAAVRMVGQAKSEGTVSNHGQVLNQWPDGASAGVGCLPEEHSGIIVLILLAHYSIHFITSSELAHTFTLTKKYLDHHPQPPYSGL
jgi:hypothetical protein